MKTKITKYLLSCFLVSGTIILMTLVVKGEKGDPIYHQSQETRDINVGGPFESSGSTSRYALTEAIVEDNTFFFSKERARFSAPDMVEYNGKFFSIFSPGISFIGIPFYMLGKSLGMAQLFTYSSTVLFALLNVFLVSKLARKLGAGLYSSLLAGFIFLFATNALSYALTYIQHHASTTIILLALLNAFGKRTLLKNLWFGALMGIGLLVDIPNVLMMAPIGLFILAQHFRVFEHKETIKVTFKLSIISLIIGLIPFLALYGWYNYQLTGSYTKIGQVIGRSDYFDPPEVREKRRLEREAADPSGWKFPLNTRKQLSEFYILLVSNQRGWIYYSPVVVIGILGLFLEYKKRQKRNIIIVAVAIVLTTIVTYSMFGGLGGWAFGPRYLIPATAILSVGIGIAVQRLKRQPLFILLFIVTALYSLGVNVLGAMTTTQVPPKVEAVNLLKPIPYTYEYNFQLLEENKISSLVYNLYLAEAILGKIFVYGYFGAVVLLMAVTTTAVVLEKQKGEKAT